MVPRSHDLRWRLGITLAVVAGWTCSPLAGEDEAGDVNLTVTARLAGNRQIGPTPGRIYVYPADGPVPRLAAYPEGAPYCALDTTPVSTCVIPVPRGATITLIAAEPDPAVYVRLAPQSPADTSPDARYVEFTGWTDCPDVRERGLCVLRPSGELHIQGNFQLMTQVTVYQTGAARMDYITIAAGPTLKVPAQSYNILDLAGCRRVLNPPAAPCDSVRLIGDDPWHRFTAYVPRQTIVGMFPVDGAQTGFVRWDGPCILSGLYGGGVCSLITPDTSGPPILLTLRYQWWDCSDGPSDRDRGTDCVLRGGTAAGEGIGAGARQAIGMGFPESPAPVMAKNERR